MRAEKKTDVIVNGAPVLVFEIQYGHAESLLDKVVSMNQAGDAVKTDITALLNMREVLDGVVSACLNIKLAEYKALGFGDIEKIWDAFRVVNAPFLRILKRLGVDLTQLEVNQSESESPSEKPLLSSIPKQDNEENSNAK